MIATIIAIIIALGTTVWAFVERHGKKFLHELIEGMKADDAVKQIELDTVKSLLADEKVFLAQEKKKLAALESKPCRCASEPIVKSMVLKEEFDIVGLVDVTEAFKIGEDERAVFFEFYKDQHAPREIRWRLKAKNNKVLADSGEGYGTKQNLKKALGVMLNAIKNGELKSRWKA